MKKVFLSYGHPEERICLKICDFMRAQGYDVWMDKSEIKEGDDWRSKIFEGISNSNGVVACLSRHACRKPGVCLNELSIAVGIKGGNIKTILLEEEERVTAPAQLCHSQWLDMHDWKEWEAAGQEVFEEWFLEKMNTLVEMIEQDGEFVGEIQSIRKILNPNTSRSRQGMLLSKPFWGREWLTNMVLDWLKEDTGDRVLLLYGAPGIGKSAFAANFMHYSEKVVGGIFCERNNVHFNEPENMIRTIAYQLACRLPAYRKALIHIFSEGNTLNRYNASELFDLLLADPLNNLYIDGNHETLCFVIDGLDECGDEQENISAQILKQYANRLPRWLRFLVTSRELASVTSIFGEIPSLKLYGDGKENLGDVKSYYQSCLSDELQQIGSAKEQEKILEHLTKSSKGIFLYAELMADSIHKGKQSIKDTMQLPDGLPEMFYQWFQGTFPRQDEFETKYRSFISLMLAIPEGIPEGMLPHILGINENQKHDLMLKMGVLLAPNRNWLGEETIVFSHQYISEWIQGEKAGKFYCSDSVGHDMLVAFLTYVYETAQEKMTVWEIFTLIQYAGTDQRRKDALGDQVVMDIPFLEKAISIGDCFIEAEEIYKGNMCYQLLATLFAGVSCENRREKQKKRASIEIENRILDRLDILHAVFHREQLKSKDKNLRQVVGEGHTAEVVEMVRKSLHTPMGDKVAESVLFQTFEKKRNLIQRGIHALAITEKNQKQWRGPVLTLPICLIVVLLMSLSLYFVYLGGQNVSYGSDDYGYSRVLGRILRLVYGCGFIELGVRVYKDRTSGKPRRWISCKEILLAGAVIVFVWLSIVNHNTFYISSFLTTLWPLTMIALANTALYKEEIRDLITQKSHPFRWSLLYYGVVLVLLWISSYRSRYSVDYTDQLGWLYMVLVAATAYLLFAKPRTEELIQFDRDRKNQSILVTDHKNEMEKEEVIRKIRKKLPVRMVSTVLFYLLAALLLILKSERVREILTSIYFEIRGIHSYRNLGWISYRLQAVSQSLKGDFSQLNSDYYVAESLPISWIRSNYGILPLMGVLFLVITLLVLMKRYIQEEIEKEFVISVQKLILFTFLFQTILGVAAELFFFTNTDMKIVFLGNTNTFLLWFLFMRISKDPQGKKKRRRDS